MKRWPYFAAILCAATPASAEVVHADPHDLSVREAVQLVVPPGEAMAAFVRVSGWWSKEHSYSGNAANLSIEPIPGGCFCERFPGGGGIEHMRVTYVKPGSDLLLTGALGPLLGEAVTGVMSVHAQKIAGGARVTIDYRATGFVNANADKLAPMVDAMLADQAKRFAAFAARGGGR